MGVVDKQLRALGIDLPEQGKALANYRPVVWVDDMIYTAGTGPLLPTGEALHVGKLGAEVTVEQGYAAARQTAINLLGSLQGELGSLDRISRLIKVTGFINAVPDFTEHPQVLNGASDLLVQVFGGRGRHARSAVGVASLPKNWCVEVELIAKVSH